MRPELDFARYAQAWGRIKHYLREGDAYQVNLTQRFSASVRGDAWDAYQWLRLLNPAPYSAFLDLPGRVEVMALLRKNGFTGFLHDPQHVAGYTSSVLKLLTNENLRRTMGRRGRRVAIEKFGAEAMIEQYVKVYESLR